MKLGDIIVCTKDIDSYPLIANKVYQITKYDNRIELDFNPKLSFSPSDIKEFFKSIDVVLKQISINTNKKHVKEKVHHLLLYIYYDLEVEKFYIEPEFVKLFEDTNDYHLILRVMYIILDLMNNMTDEEFDKFFELEWDLVWDKIGELMKEES